MFSQRVVFVDIETTDLDPRYRKVWDIGMVVCDPDGSVRDYQYFVDLTEREIERANSESLDIGGFDERYNALEAMSKTAIAHNVYEITKGAVLAGFTVDFDAQSLADLLYSKDLTPEWDYHLCDIGTFLTGKYELPWRKNQDEFAAIVGVDVIDESERHTALGDAQYAHRILTGAVDLF